MSVQDWWMNFWQQIWQLVRVVLKLQTIDPSDANVACYISYETFNVCLATKFPGDFLFYIRIKI